jgi:hypothetical protein
MPAPQSCKHLLQTFTSWFISSHLAILSFELLQIISVTVIVDEPDRLSSGFTDIATLVRAMRSDRPLRESKAQAEAKFIFSQSPLEDTIP